MRSILSKSFLSQIVAINGYWTPGSMIALIAVHFAFGLSLLCCIFPKNVLALCIDVVTWSLLLPFGARITPRDRLASDGSSLVIGLSVLDAGSCNSISPGTFFLVAYVMCC